MPPRKKAATTRVDETVVNQENPVVSEEARESTDTPEQDPDVAKLAEANKVDETVENQEAPLEGTYVDRNPGPEVYEDTAGIKYDVSKPYPELMDETSEDEKKRRAYVRQTEGALNAADWREEDNDKNYLEVEFLESGFTIDRKVWKKGEVYRVEDSEDFRKQAADIEGNFWFDQTASQQKERYGRVMFEKR